MEENIQIPDPQDDDRELRRAFQYAANRDRYDQLAELGRQLLHDQEIRRATVRRWLPWAVGGGAALFCLGFWLGRQLSGDTKSDTEQTGQEQIPAATQPDSFAYYVPSGEKFVVRMPADGSPGVQAKLEIFTPQGRSMGEYHQNDTLRPLIFKQESKPSGNGKTGELQESDPPIAATPFKQKNAPSDIVAGPKDKDGYLDSTLSARRIRVAGTKKTIEPLPAVQVKAFDKPAMDCVFFGDRILFYAPAKMVEGQPIEIIELRGAGTADGFYLRIGSQYFPLKTDGNVFDLKPVPKPTALD